MSLEGVVEPDSQVLVDLNSVYIRTADVEGFGRRPISAEVCHHFLGLTDVELQVVVCVCDFVKWLRIKNTHKSSFALSRQCIFVTI